MEEELRSALEENQSANEELQSANEELETSKEELQSTNEELTTLNDELTNRNMELVQLSSDIQNLFDSTKMPVIMVGRDLCVRRFTPIAKKVWNLISTDIGRRITDINPNIKVARLEEMLLDAVDHLKTSEQEVPEKSGQWYSLTVYPYKTTENKIDGAVIALADITVIKHAEEQINKVREYFENIVGSVPDPMVVMDKNLLVQTANRAFYHDYKVSIKRTEDRFIYELGNGQWNIPELLKRLKGVISKDLILDDFEITHQFQHIGERTVAVKARVIAENIAGKKLILMSIVDITARRKMEEALKQSKEFAEAANRSKSEFLTNISHDLRTPLNAILGFCSLLGTDIAVDKRPQMVKIMKDQSRDVLSLLNEILDASRLEARKSVFRDEAFILEDIVTTAVESMRVQVGTKKIRVACSYDKSIPRLKGDPIRVGQILNNLLSNALKYTEEGKISIKVGRAPGKINKGQCRIRVVIKDTGMGIPRGRQPYIFDPFIRAHEFMKSKDVAGHGLGLFIAKSFANLMGGDIRAVSEEGKGSEFVATLNFKIAG